jgi:hypothetical protein
MSSAFSVILMARSPLCRLIPTAGECSYQSRREWAGQGDEGVCKRLLEERREYGVDERSARDSSLLALARTSSVQPFWTSKAVDFLIPMLAAHLNAASEKQPRSACG